MLTSMANTYTIFILVVTLAKIDKRLYERNIDKTVIIPNPTTCLWLRRGFLGKVYGFSLYLVDCQWFATSRDSVGSTCWKTRRQDFLFSLVCTKNQMFACYLPWKLIVDIVGSSLNNSVHHFRPYKPQSTQIPSTLVPICKHCQSISTFFQIVILAVKVTTALPYPAL